MSARSSKTKAREFDWVVYRIRGPKADRVAHVTAPDEATAIAKVIEQFQVEPADRKRLLAQRSG